MRRSKKKSIIGRRKIVDLIDRQRFVMMVNHTSHLLKLTNQDWVPALGTTGSAISQLRAGKHPVTVERINGYLDFMDAKQQSICDDLEQDDKYPQALVDEIDRLLAAYVVELTEAIEGESK